MENNNDNVSRSMYWVLSTCAVSEADAVEQEQDFFSLLLFSIAKFHMLTWTLRFWEVSTTSLLNI